MNPRRGNSGGDRPLGESDEAQLLGFWGFRGLSLWAEGLGVFGGFEAKGSAPHCLYELLGFRVQGVGFICSSRGSQAAMATAWVRDHSRRSRVKARRL